MAFAQAPEPRTVPKAQFEKWMAELNNWGRWGKDDEKGALNLITNESRRKASRLVREGFAVSLSHDADKEPAPDNPRPFVHQMLSHSGYARAVLMDIAELKGVPYLEPGTAVYPEDLDAWEKKSGARVGPGDVLLLRTGRWAHRAAKGAQPGQRLPGLHASCIPWLKKRDIAVLGSDAASDVRPSGIEGVSQPIHIFTLAGLGAWILDNGDYEAVARAARERKRWAFLITAAPLAVPGATGSAMNPIAIF